MRRDDVGRKVPMHLLLQKIEVKLHGIGGGISLDLRYSSITMQ